MVETILLRVGRKGAIYLPRHILEKLGVEEGDRVIARVEEGRVVLEFVSDPFKLAATASKWSTTSVEEFEEESLEEQRRWESKNSARH